MCPFGSTFMKDSKKEQTADNFNLEGFDPNTPDSDDEPLSDLEMWDGTWFLVHFMYFNARIYEKIITNSKS